MSVQILEVAESPVVDAASATATLVEPVNPGDVILAASFSGFSGSRVVSGLGGTWSTVYLSNFYDTMRFALHECLNATTTGDVTVTIPPGIPWNYKLFVLHLRGMPVPGLVRSEYLPLPFNTSHSGFDLDTTNYSYAPGGVHLFAHHHLHGSEDAVYIGNGSSVSYSGNFSGTVSSRKMGFGWALTDEGVGHQWSFGSATAVQGGLNSLFYGRSVQTEIDAVGADALVQPTVYSDLQVDRVGANAAIRSSGELRTDAVYLNALTRPGYDPSHRGGWGLILPHW